MRGVVEFLKRMDVRFLRLWRLLAPSWRSFGAGYAR